jgi:hypothetical protein
MEDQGEADGGLSGGVASQVQLGDDCIFCTCVDCCSLSFFGAGYAYKLLLVRRRESLSVFWWLDGMCYCKPGV